jgi:plasmid replication initiation protein
MQGDISNNISQPKIKLKKGTSIEVIKFNDIEEERSSVDFTESTAT